MQLPDMVYQECDLKGGAQTYVMWSLMTVTGCSNEILMAYQHCYKRAWPYPIRLAPFTTRTVPDH